MKVYTPEGIEEEMDTVDARECVQHCGYYYEQPPTAPLLQSGELDGARKGKGKAAEPVAE